LASGSSANPVIPDAERSEAIRNPAQQEKS
jgi:hypothetical protein